MHEYSFDRNILIWFHDSARNLSRFLTRWYLEVDTIKIRGLGQRSLAFPPHLSIRSGSNFVPSWPALCNRYQLVIDVGLLLGYSCGVQFGIVDEEVAFDHFGGVERAEE